MVITPAWWAHHQIWYMNIDVRHARATEGVMGAIAPGNWLPALPDGASWAPARPICQQRYQDLYETFADAWRVTDATSLFDYDPGPSTGRLHHRQLADGVSQVLHGATATRRADGSVPQRRLTLGGGGKTCSAVTARDRRANCVQDVMATGEPGLPQRTC